METSASFEARFVPSPYPASYWLGAYLLWTFAGGHSVHNRLLSAYNSPVFGLVAVAGGVCHYRT